MNAMNKKGVISKGIICPFFRQGDDLASIIVNSVLEQESNIHDKDIIGITESVVARCQGNYVTIDEITEDIKSKFGENSIIYVKDPMYSRNRFAMILKAVARAASEVVLVLNTYDEVGNIIHNHPFTKLNYDDYYKEICKSENCKCRIIDEIEYVYKIFPDFYTDEETSDNFDIKLPDNTGILYCGLHDWKEFKETFKGEKVYTLWDICSDKCDWGLLGSNKATEEKLKLFPTQKGAQEICDKVKAMIKEKTGKDVIVAVYGDGCFKDPVAGIWEFADPITMPAYTDKELIESTPNEIKLKALIDNSKDNSEVRHELEESKNSDLSGNMQSMGTTPRLYRDLLASLMDLTSGSGDRETPVVLIQNYFN